MGEQKAMRKLVRLPRDVIDWLEAEAARNVSPVTSEIVPAIRFRMQADRSAA